MGEDDNLFKHKLDIILREWEHCDSNIGRLEGLCFNVRGWAITAVSAAVAFAYSNEDAFVAFIAAAGAVGFWVSELLFQGFKAIYLTRSGEIEEFLRSAELEYARAGRAELKFESPMISTLFKQRFQRGPWYGLVSGLRKGNVTIIYGSLLLLAVGTATLVLKGNP
jgi:hypothetical protein